MRHCTTLLTAALACALTLTGCGDRATAGASPADDASASAASAEPSPEPGTPATPEPTDVAAAPTSIPDDFPLSSGMAGPQDTIPTSRTGPGLVDLTVCGTAPLQAVDPLDRMVADNSGGEAANTRELVLLDSTEEAAGLARRFADLATGCDTKDVRGNAEIRTEVRASAFGAAPAATLVQTFTFDGEPGDGAIIVHVVPVGAALLVTSTYGTWSDDTAEGDPIATVEPLRETVMALDVFDEEA